MSRAGSVKKDPTTGGYFFVVDISRPGEPRKQLKRRFPTYREARKALTKVVSTVDEGSFIVPSKQTLRDFVEGTWLPEVQSQLRPSTLHSYSRNLRLHVLPVLGDRPLQALTGGMLTKLYNELLVSGVKDAGKLIDGKPRGLSVRSVRYLHTILGAALQSALEHDLLTKNPAKLAKPPKASAIADGKERLKVWTSQELSTFLAAERPDRHHATWHLLAMTGMRRGEALGLGWKNVDLEAGKLTIRRTLVDVEDRNDDEPVWSDPKTAKGNRTIELDAATVAVLKALRAEQARERLLFGPGYREHDLVLCWPDGRPYHPERVSRSFQARVRKHRLPMISVHGLRHTWATLALEAGVHPKVVQERLGHANISITLDIYSHVTSTIHNDAAELVAALINGGSA
ncbi:site-specific integrase [soil metagenome]